MSWSAFMRTHLVQNDTRARFRRLKSSLAPSEARSYDLDYLQTLF